MQVESLTSKKHIGCYCEVVSGIDVSVHLWKKCDQSISLSHAVFEHSSLGCSSGAGGGVGLFWNLEFGLPIRYPLCQNFVENEKVYTEQMCIISELATYKHAADTLPDQVEDAVGSVDAQRLFSLHAAQSEHFHGDDHESLTDDDQTFLLAWKLQPGFLVTQRSCEQIVQRLSAAVKKAVLSKVMEQKEKVCAVVLKDPWRPREDDGSTKTLGEPYHEDYVVLPTRSNIRVDNKSVAQEARSRSQPDDTSLSRWSPSSWLNTLLEKHA